MDQAEQMPKASGSTEGRAEHKESPDNELRKGQAENDRAEDQVSPGDEVGRVNIRTAKVMRWTKMTHMLRHG